VKAELDTVLALLKQNTELVTLLQRYNLPFAYVRGSAHTQLSGTGTISLPTGLLGLELLATKTTDGRGTSPGTPTYFFDLGWVSVLDPADFIAEKRVTRDRQLWTPPGMQLAKRIGYNLQPGTLLDVVEILAEK
jgi:hypothetical protein